MKEERTFNTNLLEDRRGFFIMLKLIHFSVLENPIKL